MPRIEVQDRRDKALDGKCFRTTLTSGGLQSAVRQAECIAHELAVPTERQIKVDGEVRALRLDVRFYAYKGSLLLVAARVYQGRTTDFKTPGGDVAPVFIV